MQAAYDAYDPNRSATHEHATRHKAHTRAKPEAPQSTIVFTQTRADTQTKARESAKKAARHDAFDPVITHDRASTHTRHETNTLTQQRTNDHTSRRTSSRPRRHAVRSPRYTKRSRTTRLARRLISCAHASGARDDTDRTRHAPKRNKTARKRDKPRKRARIYDKHPHNRDATQCSHRFQ